jgi:tetratricopeptide (TPR) repeat protein
MNRERRLVILLSTLLLALGWLLFDYTRPFWAPPGSAAVRNNGVLPGDNALIAVKLARIEPYQAHFEIEYFYNGANGPTAHITVEVLPAPGTSDPAKKFAATGYAPIAKPGKHKVNVVAHRFTVSASRMESRILKVALKDSNGAALAERTFDQIVQWPSIDPFVLNSNEPDEIERLYKLCVKTIDSGQLFDHAKSGLEQILLAKPDYVPAYAELARYHMKTNWNQEGLGQAERALESALRIDPKHANSLVLLGYVYAHEGRFKDAENTLRAAEAIGTSNIWLYTNLGEMYAMQNHMQQAITAYGKAIEAPASLETYERARADAYWRLIDILIAKRQLKKADELYAKRIEKFPDNGCYKADHADFRLRKFGDYESAIALGTKSLEQGCQDAARKVLSMAYYTKGAAVLKAGAKPSEADQYLNRAQALYADMPNLLLALAGSDSTLPVISVLKRRGVQIDTSDRNGLTALALSIASGNSNAARVLIRQGADVNRKLSEDGLTPVMIAASRGDKAMVTLLLKNGADRKARTRFGYTADMFAAQQGFEEVARLLNERHGI